MSNLYHFCLLSILFSLLSITVTAQPSAGFQLTGSLGLFKASGGTSVDRSASPLALELGYQLPVSARFSLLGGAGVQRREQELYTAVGEPCFFPNGIKLVSYSDTESYLLRQSEAYLSVGMGYHLGRVRVHAAALPTVRLSNDIRYRFYRDFAGPIRPVTEIDVTVAAGEAVNLSAIGRSPEVIRYSSRFNLQAEFGAQFSLTPHLNAGIAWRPVLLNYRLARAPAADCSGSGCADNFSDNSEDIGTLRGDAFLLQVGWRFSY